MLSTGLHEEENIPHPPSPSPLHVESRPRGEVLPRKVLNDEVSDTTADAIKNKSSLNKNSQNSQHTFSQNIGKLPKCWESLAMKNLRFVKA